MLDGVKTNLLFLGDDMEIEYEAIFEGKKIYNVRRRGHKTLFTGTLDQCRRFLDIYREKITKQI